MKSILLCEGETDQIILSYYFINQFSFEYDEERSHRIRHYARKGVPYAYVQKVKSAQHENELVIWNVGGRDNIPAALEHILKLNSFNTDRFYERIIVIADKDAEEESAVFWNKIKEIITNNDTKAKFAEQEWFKGNLTCEFDAIRTVNFLMLNLPAEGNGALETFLLYALKERGKADKYIAQRAQMFVDSLVKNQARFDNMYLNKRRLRTKAPLAVFFGITSPDRVFTEMNDMLKAINWERYKTIQKGFEKLSCFKC